MSCAVAYDAGAWERLSRQASIAVAMCDDLLAEIAGMLLAPPPPIRDWPGQFATREAWLRWCEEDRLAEALEITLDAIRC